MMFLDDLDTWTTLLGRAAWNSLGQGTVLVLATAVLLLLLQRRVPAGVQALLWSVALLKFVIPCGPALTGSLSQGIALAGEPIPLRPEDVLDAGHRPSLLVLKLGLLAVYLTVTGLLAARLWDRWRRLAREIEALPPAGEATLALIAACALRLGVRVPDVRLSEMAVSPHVAGVFRPRLIMPRWLVGRGDAEQAFVLHELAHLARRDHWLILALALIETVFWFWPPVRYATARLRSAREAACDAAAVRVGPLGAADYARSLVGAARVLAPRPAGGLVLGGVCTRLEERVEHLLRARRPPRGVLVVAALAMWGIWALSGARVTASPRVERLRDDCNQPR